jgi:hypothetical protein
LSLRLQVILAILKVPHFLKPIVTPNNSKCLSSPGPSNNSQPIIDLEPDARAQPPSGNPKAACSSSKPSKARSDVFAYIQVASGQNLHWFCLLFRNKNVVKCWKKKSKTIFRRHLEQNHPKQYSTGDNSNAAQAKMKHFLKAVPGSSGASYKRKKAPRNDFTRADKAFADRKLTDWIVNHSKSFSVVDQVDFGEY